MTPRKWRLPAAAAPGTSPPTGALAPDSAPPPTGAPSVDLSWVPEFWRSVRGYVYVREEDEVVILPPNKVYKTNSGGVRVIRFLEAGGRIERMPGLDGHKLCDVAAFLSDIRDICDGREVAAGTVPYDFDFTRLPVLGEIAVTYRCNNACRFCYAGCGGENGCGPRPRRAAIGGLPARSPAGADLSGADQAGGGPIGEGPKGGPPGHSSGEASRRDIERIIDIFRDRAKIPFFSFTGGEPLLRDDLEALVRHAVSRNLRVNLITNGTLADARRARSLFRAGLRTAQVSIESPDEATHDSLCGAQGSWKRTIAGIKALRDAGIAVQTNSTVTAANMESLRSMPPFLESLGVTRFSMNLFIPARSNPHSGGLFVPYAAIGDFVDHIRALAAGRGMTFFWYSPTPLCIYNPMARGLGNRNCAAADGLVSVDPEGSVLPCSSYPEPIGNLLSQDFGDVWFSARASHFKRKRYAPQECRACGSFMACQAACPLYWDYAGYGELERHWAALRGRASPGAAEAEAG